MPRARRSGGRSGGGASASLPTWANVMNLADNTAWLADRLTDTGCVASFVPNASGLTDQRGNVTSWNSTGIVRRLCAGIGRVGYNRWTKTSVVAALNDADADYTIRFLLQPHSSTVPSDVVLLDHRGTIGDGDARENILFEGSMQSNNFRVFHESGTGDNHIVVFDLPAWLVTDLLWGEITRTNDGANCTYEMWVGVNGGDMAQCPIVSVSGMTDNGDNTATGTKPAGGEDAFLASVMEGAEDDIAWGYLQILHATPTPSERTAVYNALRNP